jgi:hypothetical protein
MAFSLSEWTEQVRERLQSWAQAPRDAWRDAGAQTLFGYLAAMTLFPLAEALARGDSMDVGLTLGAITAGVGGNLIAEQVQRWKDRVDQGQAGVARAGPNLEATLATSPDLSEALDAILDELDVIHQAHEALPEPDRQWLVEQLRADLDTFPTGFARTTAAVGDIYSKIAVQGGRIGAIGGREHTIKFVEHEEHHHYPAPLPIASPRLTPAAPSMPI